jgi:putative ABC transport system permease protein
VMRESMLLVTLGVATGVVVALAAGRFVSSLVYGLSATDAATIVIAVAVLACVSAVAAYLPARRASRIDPATALRSE